jgi:hypothetical protein
VQDGAGRGLPSVDKAKAARGFYPDSTDTSK